MAVFEYEGINQQGQMSVGNITAEDSAAALAKLKESGLTVLEMKEKKARTGPAFPVRSKKVKVEELALFSRQLAAMVGAGIHITQALSTLGKETTNPLLQKAIQEIAADVEGGSSLTSAFSKHDKIFNPLYISMISAGEVGGMLENSLLRLAEQLQKDKQLRDNIKSATSYPKMIGGFAILMFTVMLVVMVPIFEGFIPAGTPLPWITEVIFALSANIRDFWLLWLGLGILLVLGISFFFKSKTGYLLWEQSKLRLPLFGPIILKAVVARFARTLATLLEGGINIVQALQSAGPTSGSYVVAKAVEESIRWIEEGKSIAAPLRQSGVFPPMVISMISIGEEAGTLPQMLDKIAEFYEEDVATLTKNLGSTLEPIMIILIGLVVGGMLLAMYLPIFTAVTSS